MRKPYEKPSVRDATPEEAQRFAGVNSEGERDTWPAPPSELFAECGCFFPTQELPEGQQWTHAPECGALKP